MIVISLTKWYPSHFDFDQNSVTFRAIWKSLEFEKMTAVSLIHKIISNFYFSEKSETDQNRKKIFLEKTLNSTEVAWL